MHVAALCRGVPSIFGDWAVFLLVIWWFAHEKIGYLVILKSCGDGDLAILLLVIWWLVPEKIGDLVILSSYGDGDLAIFSSIGALEMAMSVGWSVCPFDLAF